MTPAIKEIFNRSRRSLSEILLESISELGKHYSRLELAYAKLTKRERELFDRCASYLSMGMKSRAIVYANEIAEIRKIMSIVQGAQLLIEKAILRLETFKAVTPSLEDIRGVFGEIRRSLEAVTKVMPSLTPELNEFINSVSDLLAATEMSPSRSELVVPRDEATEAILKEVSEFLKQEIERRIPEPPEGPPMPEPSMVATKTRIALTVDGSEAYVNEDNSLVSVRGDRQSALMEALIMDYIERNHGEMNISRCAEELNVPPAKIIETIEALNRKGKIRIE